MLLTRRLVAVLAVTPITMVAAALGPGVIGAQAATGRDATARITVTELHGPDGEPLQRAMALNERGQIVAMSNINFGTTNAGDVVLWNRGAATRISPEGAQALPEDISERGQVVGSVYADESYTTVPFSWSNGEWRDLPVGDDTDGAATAVNNRGQVFGRERTTTYPDRDFAMKAWQGDDVTTTAVDPGAQWATPVDINDHGQAVFNVQNPQTAADHAFLWQVGGDVVDLGNLGDSTSAYDINDRGQVVGSSFTGSETHAVLWEDGEMTDLGTLGGTTSEAIAVNDRGQIVGRSLTEAGDQHAFLWEDGEMTDLGTLGGTTSEAVDINDRGQIVGRSSTEPGAHYYYDHPVLWEDGEMTDLDALLENPSNGLLWEDFNPEINNRGQIIGTVPYQNESQNVFRAVLWTTHRRG